jgi:hypothetical protein
MSSGPNTPEQEPPLEENGQPKEQSNAYFVIKWLAIIFLGVPLGLIVVAALVFGICMLTMN